MLQSTSSFVQSVKKKRKDWPWWTARCSAPCQSSAEVPCRPKKSLIHFFFFFLFEFQGSSPSDKAQWLFTHTHPNKSADLKREKADLKCCSGCQQRKREAAWVLSEGSWEAIALSTLLQVRVEREGPETMGGVLALIYPEPESMRRELKIGSVHFAIHRNW